MREDALKPQDRLRGCLPPVRIHPLQIRAERLQEDHGRERVEIDAVDTGVHDEVAHDSSHDQQVERGEEEIVVSEVVKAYEGGLHELATG